LLAAAVPGAGEPTVAERGAQASAGASAAIAASERTVKQFMKTPITGSLAGAERYTRCGD
jgi:hypothetical protein